MEFDFSDDQKQLKDQARRFLEAKSSPKAVRAILEGPEPYDKALWKGLAEMGFMGTAIPEEFGGLGATYLELCVIAEELGRAVAPVPFSSSIFVAAEFLLMAGTQAQKEAYLPKLASGELIGCLALAEGVGNPAPKSISASVERGKLTGVKMPVLDGNAADFAIVAARTGMGHDARSISLFLVDLKGEGVGRENVETIDPTRKQAKIEFSGAAAEPLGATGDGWRILTEVLDRAAVLTAFEQLGGADRALEMARDYALDRMAFGRPIGSFQAVKHMLADMYVSATLARSNCYYGAWALSTNAAELPEAAATARVSATQAYQHCSKNNIQVHGGMGFTWEFDCHLYYRRSNLLALTLGSLSVWEDKLIERLRAKNAA
ncbi:MAG: acyl-CoA/acyl-ACP dehydrogenase [Parvibaculum sp.]|uniref:acyl-CoA dehydrogenase family protein n=1 Tax=Parvibaculum sp. TaxID=2024848 RepID=UPI0025F6B55D|nr:acyl-CoA dehydrogenase family protein [Parvibaculum sp.]MCE9648505.1 acyl-CoA/acyl-ACP dehydrogenase [Parvibaculum sp.]